MPISDIEKKPELTDQQKYDRAVAFIKGMFEERLNKLRRLDAQYGKQYPGIHEDLGILEYAQQVEMLDRL